MLGSWIALFVVAVVASVLFVLLRKVVLWYFRINEIVDLLTQVVVKLVREGAHTLADIKRDIEKGETK